jgi:hypothetical protein
MGNEDWIKKIFDEKKAQNDSANLEAAVENDRRKRFDAEADDFGQSGKYYCKDALWIANSQKVQTQHVLICDQSLKRWITIYPTLIRPGPASRVGQKTN